MEASCRRESRRLSGAAALRWQEGATAPVSPPRNIFRTVPGSDPRQPENSRMCVGEFVRQLWRRKRHTGVYLFGHRSF